MLRDACAAVARLEAGYAPLFERIVDVCERDARVRALWLSGSLARGVADIASDLDVIVTIADDAFDEFTAAWQSWLAAITPTVIARALPFAPGCFYSVTPERLRLDVVSEKAGAVSSTMFTTRLAVFDRDGLEGELPAEPPAPGPKPARIAGLVEEFFRQYGMFNTIVERDDWLLGVEAVHAARTMLYELYVESNAPLAPMGMKRWSEKLTPDQRSVLEALPTGAPTPEAVVAAREEVARVFVTAARDVCARTGVEWPAELETATLAYLRSLGLPSYDR